MAIREIRLFGDPILKTPCAPITEIDDAVRAHAQDLLDTVDLEGRAGVASNQIGHRLRAFSLNIDGDKSVILNPNLVEVDGDPIPMGEGCLSLPGLWFDVLRYPRATVHGMDIDGNDIVVTGEGLLAQALQHECDHLEGKLYIDRLDGSARGEAMRQIRASEWF